MRSISLVVLSFWALSAYAAAINVPLGTADSFAVLGGSTVTNTGATHVHGDLGVSPGSAITGFPPGIVSGGTTHAGDAAAAQAQSDLTTAYNFAAGEPYGSGDVLTGPRACPRGRGLLRGGFPSMDRACRIRDRTLALVAC